MLRLLAIAGLIAVCAPWIAEAQSEPGHVYSINSFKAHTGSEAEYSQGYWDVIRPVWDRAMSQGAIVSYLELTKVAGEADTTHIILLEFEDWGHGHRCSRASERARPQRPARSRGSGPRGTWRFEHCPRGKAVLMARGSAHVPSKPGACMLPLSARKGSPFLGSRGESHVGGGGAGESEPGGSRDRK